ncbi:hypothetical protein NQZ68_024313 [Dissostichus eleginoides]|nr:hypothetical protein NQZ68_024313 [Dissostichus eleginoides]
MSKSLTECQHNTKETFQFIMMMLHCNQHQENERELAVRMRQLEVLKMQDTRLGWGQRDPTEIHHSWDEMNGSAAGEAAVAIGEHQTAQGQGAERSNPNPSQNETAGEGAEDVGGHQAGLGQGAERPNRNPSQWGFCFSRKKIVEMTFCTLEHRSPKVKVCSF